MRAIDWLGRVLLLVLSGTATLSLVGAIVETTSTRPLPVERAADRRVGTSAPPSDGPVIRMPAGPGDAIEPVATTPDHERDRWLRALTYAVTALAGFAAAGVVVLLRITATLDRIARR